MQAIRGRHGARRMPIGIQLISIEDTVQAMGKIVVAGKRAALPRTAGKQD
jgi:hypothetical protein